MVSSRTHSPENEERWYEQKRCAKHQPPTKASPPITDNLLRHARIRSFSSPLATAVLRTRVPAPPARREAPGVVHAIYQGGLKFTPLAVLSRPVAGTRNNTLVVTLPGSVKAVKENLGSLVPLLPRIVNLLKGNPC